MKKYLSEQTIISVVFTALLALLLGLAGCTLFRYSKTEHLGQMARIEQKVNAYHVGTLADVAGACKGVLDLCEHDGILDARGVEAYHRMSTIDEYVELIQECENEECFNDVIAGTDAYERYVELVRNVD